MISMRHMEKKVTITKIPTSEIQKKLQNPNMLPPEEKVELEKILKLREEEKKK